MPDLPILNPETAQRFEPMFKKMDMIIESIKTQVQNWEAKEKAHQFCHDVLYGIECAGYKKVYSHWWRKRLPTQGTWNA